MLPHGHRLPPPRPWQNDVAPMVLYPPPTPPPQAVFLYPPLQPYHPGAIAPFHPPPWPYHPAAMPIGPYGAPARPPPPYHAAAVPYFGHPMPAAVQEVELQPVTAANFAAELDLIGSLLPSYPYVVVDTEYPGTVHRAPDGRSDVDLSPDERYALVKANVDELPIVQLGITLCDAHGNLPFVPDYGGGGGFAQRTWEVDFSDFDVARDRHAAPSVAFLRSQGVDFDAARARGVSSAAFGAKLAAVLAAPRWGVQLTWVAFGGAYDLAYLVKMLGGGQPLPETRQGFMARVRGLLGGWVFDAKYMAHHCGLTSLRGVGLRSVAVKLGLLKPDDPDEPAAGAEPELPWVAGTKSFIAYRIHTVLRWHVLSLEAADAFEGIIDGLQ